MKHLKHFLALAIILLAGKIHSQVLEDMKAPTMPAATIIGTQINEISKPKSLNALETAILNNFISTNKVLIPNNYAFEINPFMLGKRTNFDYMDYLKDSVKQNLWRNLSFSVASTNNFLIHDSITTNALGLGGRTIILNGKVNQKLEETYKNIVTQYLFLKASETQIRTMMGVYIQSANPFQIDSLRHFLLAIEQFKTSEHSEIINNVFDQLPVTTNKGNIRNEFINIFKRTLSSNALKEFEALIDSVKIERYGWRWEIDAAMGLSFPTNNFDYSISPQQGVWSNLTYRPFKKEEAKGKSGKYYKVPRNFEFIGLVRWINNNDNFMNKYNPVDTVQFKTGTIFDSGLRAVIQFGKLSAEIEYIYRMNKNQKFVIVNGQKYSRTINDDTYKLVLNLNYNISKNIIFSYNIGKNYTMINSNSGNLISGFSLSLGFGEAKKDELLSEVMKQIK